MKIFLSEEERESILKKLVVYNFIWFVFLGSLAFLLIKYGGAYELSVLSTIR